MKTILITPSHSLVVLLLMATLQFAKGYEDYEGFYEEYYDLDTDPPQFLAQPQTFTVEAGQALIIPCDVENQGSLKLVIKKLGMDGMEHLLWVGREKMARTRRLNMETGTPKLTITHARPSDAGTYICHFDTTPPVELKHRLDVLYAPTVKATVPPEHRVAKGSSVTLACDAKGNPPAVIRWSRQEGPLPSGQRQQEGLSITLEDVDRHVEGTYLCTADNGIGQPSIAAITVIVEYPPEITTEKAVIRTGEGDEIQLVCLVHGRPAPQVFWSQDGNPVSTETGGKVEVRHPPYSRDHYSNGHVAEHNPDHLSLTHIAHRHTLTLNKVSEKDFGAYMCVATNTQGENSAVIQITGLPRPPHFTSSPHGGEADSYTLTWETESYYPITELMIKYRKPQENGSDSVVPEPWKSTSRVINEPQDSPDLIHHMVHRLYPLDIARDYEATIRVRNKYGWSSESPPFRFSTRKARAVQQTTNASDSHVGLSMAKYVITILVLIIANSLQYRTL